MTSPPSNIHPPEASSFPSRRVHLRLVKQCACANENTIEPTGVVWSTENALLHSHRFRFALLCLEMPSDVQPCIVTPWSSTSPSPYQSARNRSRLCLLLNILGAWQGMRWRHILAVTGRPSRGALPVHVVTSKENFFGRKYRIVTRNIKQ